MATKNEALGLTSPFSETPYISPDEIKAEKLRLLDNLLHYREAHEVAESWLAHRLSSESSPEQIRLLQVLQSHLKTVSPTASLSE